MASAYNLTDYVTASYNYSLALKNAGEANEKLSQINYTSPEAKNLIDLAQALDSSKSAVDALVRGTDLPDFTPGIGPVGLLDQYQQWNKYSEASQIFGQSFSDHAFNPSQESFDQMLNTAAIMMEAAGGIVQGIGLITGNPGMIAIGAGLSILGWFVKQRSPGNVPTLDSSISTWFQHALTTASPIILDLDGDGVETLKQGGAILFDHQADGIKEGTGWVGKDDGLLVLDRNGNGQVDSGRELFGTNTQLSDGNLAANGFEALKDLDTNADGKVDSSDAQWTQLRIWKDTNSNGVVDNGELVDLNTVNGVGIRQIDVSYQEANEEDASGNFAIAKGDFVWKDGHSAAAIDIDFVVDKFYRSFTDQITIPNTLNDLPDIQGSGAVRDLREASAQSPVLAATLRQYAEATSREQQLALIDKLIFDWAQSNTEIQDWVSRLSNVTFNYMQDDSSQVRALNFRFAYQGALNGTPDQVIDGVDYYWDVELSQYLTYKNYAGSELLVGRFADDTKVDAMAKVRVLEAFSNQEFYKFSTDTTDFNNDGTSDYLQVWVTGGTQLQSSAFSLPKTESDYVIPPELSKDSFDIGAEQLRAINVAYDALRQSIYEGLLLQTRLRPYLDGIDLQVRAQSGFKIDFSSMDALLEAGRARNVCVAICDLVDLIKAVGADFSLKGWNGISLLREWVEQSDDIAELKAIFEDMGVKLGSGWLEGALSADILFGQASDDYISGSSGADFLDGGSGNDLLNGGDGNDMLDGGSGNDQLYGDAGNDIYKFARGSGSDTIYNYDFTAGKLDVIQLSETLSPSDVALTRTGDSLILSINDTSDTLNVNSFFYDDANDGNAYRVEKIVFADGTVWGVDEIKNKVLVGNESAQNLIGYDTADAIYAAGGDDWVEARGGKDVLGGDAGADYVLGGEGDDVLSGGLGADYLNGGVGNDSIYGDADDDLVLGGEGDDTLDGGEGSDYLSGGEGSDLYKFCRNGGQDNLDDYDSLARSSDQLMFDSDISIDQLWFRQEGNSLEVSIVGTDDKVTIQNWYADSVFRVEQFKTADGRILLDSQVDNLVNAMAVFSPPSAGQTTLQQSYQDLLSGVIAANWQ